MWNTGWSVGKPLLIGGVLGLILGLLLWIVSLAHSMPSLNEPTARPERCRPAPSATPRGGAEFLGEAETAKGRSNETAEKQPALNESARGTAIRYAWRARMPIADYRGALDVIDQGGLGSSERVAQLHELADRLVPPDWIGEPNFPRSEAVENRYRRPGGRDDLSHRWEVANTLVDQLPTDPAKIDLLARLELFAHVLGEAGLHKSGATAALPALKEVDNEGRPKPAPAEVKPTAALGPLLDVEKETHRLRTKLDAELRRVENVSLVQAYWREARTSWNFLRTVFLSAFGAGLAALFKTYGESLASRLQQQIHFGSTVASNDAASSSDPPTRDS